MARLPGRLACSLIALVCAAGVFCPSRALADGRPYTVFDVITDSAVPLLPLSPLSSMPLHATDRLLFTWDVLVPLTDVSVTDQLPEGLVVASSPNVTVTMYGGTAGTVTADPGSRTISLSGFSFEVPPLVTVDVTGTTAGMKTDQLTSSSDQGAASYVGSVGVDVVAPPSIAASFSPASLAGPGNSALSFTVTNPSANDASLSDVDFTAALPAGLSVASPNGLTGSCGGGTIAAVAADTTMGLSGATLAFGTSCTFSVAVSASVDGYYSATTGQIGSSNGGPGNAASANLSVGLSPPTISAAFGAATIPFGGSTTLTFTLANRNQDATQPVRPNLPGPGVMTLSGIGFTDTLPAGLLVATPNGLTGSCDGGTITAAPGTRTISLSGATLPAGANCTFSVGVVGTTAGALHDSTGPVGSTEGGSGTGGQATIVVQSPTPTPTPTDTPTAAPTPTSGATPPATSTAEPTPSGDGPAPTLAFLAGLAVAACLMRRVGSKSGLARSGAGSRR